MTPETSNAGFTIEHLHAAGGALAREAARFASLGWMRGTSGNLSMVVHRDPLRLAVTASGRDKGELESHHVVLVDALGEAVEPEAGRPSAEAALHARICSITGAGAVVHVHHLDSVVVAERHRAGIEVHGLEMLKGIGRAAHDDTVHFPVIDNSQDMVVLGDRFEAAYDADTPAVIVARHGLYVWGSDLTQARHHTEIVTWVMEFVAAHPDFAVDAPADHQHHDPVRPFRHRERNPS